MCRYVVYNVDQQCFKTIVSDGKYQEETKSIIREEKNISVGQGPHFRGLSAFQDPIFFGIYELDENPDPVLVYLDYMAIR